jgi:GntR family transcriptional regulator
MAKRRTSSKSNGAERQAPLFGRDERFLLDAQSPIPLYHQMEKVILDRITKERHSALGRMLPREMDLVEIFGVSRATVKKTTDSLAAKGLIERRRALGTRIVRLGVTEDLGRLTSYTEQMEKRGLNVSTRVLDVALGRPVPAVATALQLGPRDKTLSIRRLRGTSEVFPVVLLRSEIPAAFGLSRGEDFSQSLYRLIEEKYRIPIEWAEETIRAAKASGQEARLLRMKSGDTVLIMERLTFTTGDRPVEFVRAVYRPEHYTFSIRLKR